MSTYRLEIITRDKVFFDEEVNEIVARGVEGDFAVLVNHSPLVTFLKIAPIKIYDSEKKLREASLTGGLIKVNPEKVTILAEAAEWPEEIDVERAKAAKERAEKRLSDNKYDIVRAEAALQRALMRLNLSEKYNR
ncbi:ATP synthase F1 subunit epsilon [Garciella nitratireducens]|uniref:ATP synthase F1 subunit epsilon n=1 Tax=Garciella nitratireducens TaxID=218205 RepID=UPI001BD46CD2|nr:ATP synthase F1 subunit epsilon [Garciella nitratireducens]